MIGRAYIGDCINNRNFSFYWNKINEMKEWEFRDAGLGLVGKTDDESVTLLNHIERITLLFSRGGETFYNTSSKEGEILQRKYELLENTLLLNGEVEGGIDRGEIK